MEVKGFIGVYGPEGSHVVEGEELDVVIVGRVAVTVTVVLPLGSPATVDVHLEIQSAVIGRACQGHRVTDFRC